MASSTIWKLGKSLLLFKAFVPEALVNARQSAQIRLAAESKKRQLPPLTSPANAEEHVCVPLEGYGQKIEDLFEGDEFAFVRGGVAVGKSTLHLYLARQNPKFVSVPFGDGKYPSWRENIVKAIMTAM
ncbi:AAA domain-containing protein [Durusdinium trenchii]|uniref:AAA domain-containing protein n=1 Tax=Durusdinium trenchii TaxID=1381693 RepID=A0ABP0PFS6_9DINO